MKSKKTGRAGERYVIVRPGRASSVFAGVLVSRNGMEVVLRDARRIWYWAGAATLSKLAQRGTKKPSECKFPAPVARAEILDACEVLDCTPEARTSIEEVPEWRA